MRGYTRRNLFRMRQFFEAYRDQEKVSPLVSQLPWTHHLIVLSRTKHPEDREFYMLAAIRGRWTKRELERQIKSSAALRAAPGRKKVSPALTQIHPTAAVQFKNEYSLEFLGLPDDHSEADLHGGLLRNLGRFITELGRDFCFVGSEYPVQVGKQDLADEMPDWNEHEFVEALPEMALGSAQRLQCETGASAPAVVEYLRSLTEDAQAADVREIEERTLVAWRADWSQFERIVIAIADELERLIEGESSHEGS
jgi:predicted nuclease of restriction endonuclease-like (RecB) superfamily